MLPSLPHSQEAMDYRGLQIIVTTFSVAALTAVITPHPAPKTPVGTPALQLTSSL